MQRLFVILAVIFLSYLSIPASLNAAGDEADLMEYSRISFGSKFVEKGEYDKAIALFNEVIRMNPKNSQAWCSRGIAWHKKGEYDKAIADYSESIRLNPNVLSSGVYTDRGITWAVKGEYDKAIADYNQALTQCPIDPDALCNRGKAWAKKGKHDKAIADYNEAIKAYKLLNGKSWTFIDTLAAGYAESGDFEKAKEWQAKAIELVKADKSATDKDKAEANSRLELYMQNKPYREDLKK